MRDDLPGKGRRYVRKMQTGAILIAFFLALAIVNCTTAAAYAPKSGVSFSYSESITVNNGQGSYDGYTDQTLVTGSESMASLNGTSVLAHYDTSYSFSSNQGSSYKNSSSGNYTWSAENYQYLNGTDNQVGYSQPIYVWFSMNPSLPVNGTFFALNTQLTILSKNMSFQLTGNGSMWVQTIHAEGSGEYQRHDSYGTFTATYTWDEYFDPTSGYIVGYHYVEQDNGQYQGQAGSFTLTDDLYVTSTTYALAPGSPSSNQSSSSGTDLGLILLGLAIVVVLIIIVVAVFMRRNKRDRLPEHSPAPATSTPAPWQSNVNLGSRPPEQVVIRDVAKVNCRYCGTLIPTTADTCPYCGGPRR